MFKINRRSFLTITTCTLAFPKASFAQEVAVETTPVSLHQNLQDAALVEDFQIYPNFRQSSTIGNMPEPTMEANFFGIQTELDAADFRYVPRTNLANTKTKARTKTKTKSPLANASERGAPDLNAFAVEEAKYIQRLHDHFDVMRKFTDQPTLGGQDGLGDPTPYELIKPPVVNGDALEAELEILRQFNAERETNSDAVRARLDETLAQVDDIMSPFLDRMYGEEGVPSDILRLMSLMETAGHFIVAPYKEKFNRPRPAEVDNSIAYALPVPNHSAYPSGHALQAYLIAFGLIDAMGDNGPRCMALMETAGRIAENREFAGVHYPSDSQASETLARLVFPLLRTLFHEVFADAAAAQSADGLRDCDLGRSSALAQTWNLEPSGSGPQDDVTADTDPVTATIDRDWHKKIIGITDESNEATTFPVTVGLVDTAIDVLHPDLIRDGESVIDKFQRYNIDFPCPQNEPTAFGATGTAHGTAMAGIIAGQAVHAPKGIAPSAFVAAARVSSFLNDTHENRLTLGTLLQDMAFPSDTQGAFQPIAAILIGPPIEAPIAGSYLVDQIISKDEGDLLENFRHLHGKIAAADTEISRASAQEVFVNAYLESNMAPCDPLLLSILALQPSVPIVIPTGNEGRSQIPYPGNHVDYWKVARMLDDNVGRSLCGLMMAEILGADMDAIRHADNWVVVDQEDNTRPFRYVPNPFALGESLKELAKYTPSFDPLSSLSDPFSGTGIVLVGAAIPDADGSAVLLRASYSNYGSGVAVLAPSAAHSTPPATCQQLASWETTDSTIATTDLFGHAGFADDPRAFASAVESRRGFGGTSAAAAIVTGMLAHIASDAGVVAVLKDDWGIKARERLVGMQTMIDQTKPSDADARAILRLTLGG